MPKTADLDKIQQQCASSTRSHPALSSLRISGNATTATLQQQCFTGYNITIKWYQLLHYVQSLSHFFYFWAILTNNVLPYSILPYSILPGINCSSSNDCTLYNVHALLKLMHSHVCPAKIIEHTGYLKALLSTQLRGSLQCFLQDMFTLSEHSKVSERRQHRINTLLQKINTLRSSYVFLGKEVVHVLRGDELERGLQLTMYTTTIHYHIDMLFCIYVSTLSAHWSKGQVGQHSGLIFTTSQQHNINIFLFLLIDPSQFFCNLSTFFCRRCIVTNLKGFLQNFFCFLIFSYVAEGHSQCET